MSCKVKLTFARFWFLYGPFVWKASTILMMDHDLQSFEKKIQFWWKTLEGYPNPLK